MSGDYDFWYGGNSLEIPDALTGFLSGYTSAMQSALRGYSNEEYDKLYDEAIASPTIEDRKANYFEVEKFFCDNTLVTLDSITQLRLILPIWIMQNNFRIARVAQ